MSCLDKPIVQVTMKVTGRSRIVRTIMRCRIHPPIQTFATGLFFRMTPYIPF
jgi:hypothetical protein